MTKKENPRDFMASARLTEREMDLVKDEAARRDMTVTDLVRSALLQQRPESTGARLAEIEARIAEQDDTIHDMAIALNRFRETLAEATRAILISNEEDERNHPAITQWVAEELLGQAPDAGTEPEGSE
tara:strand:+ start:1954 stop:2337 length:384 start_codon:yes stop_codon:yes gene_type:complete